MCFYANLGRQFLKSNNVGRYFYPDFQGFCPDFQQITTFGDALATLHPQLFYFCPFPTEPSPESLQYGLYVCSGGLYILKFDKNSTDS